MRGDRGAVGAIRLLADLLEQLGHTVLTRRLLLDDVDAQEGQLSEREVFERDLRWLEAADVLIAEASGSSYGVGFEVGYVVGRAAQDRSTRAAALRRRPAAVRVQADRRHTHPACTTYPYRDAEDLLQLSGCFWRSGRRAEQQ